MYIVPALPESTEMTFATMLSKAEVELVPEVLTRLPDIKVQVLPRATKQERWTAARAYGMTAEWRILSLAGISYIDAIGPTIDEKVAAELLEYGDVAIAEVTSDTLDGLNRFWNELVALSTNKALDGK